MKFAYTVTLAREKKLRENATGRIKATDEKKNPQRKWSVDIATWRGGRSKQQLLIVIITYTQPVTTTTLLLTLSNVQWYAFGSYFELAFFQRFVSPPFFFFLLAFFIFFLFVSLSFSTLERSLPLCPFSQRILFSSNVCCSPVTFVYQPNDHLCTFSIFLMRFFSFFFFSFGSLVSRVIRSLLPVLDVFFLSTFRISLRAVWNEHRHSVDLFMYTGVWAFFSLSRSLSLSPVFSHSSLPYTDTLLLWVCDTHLSMSHFWKWFGNTGPNRIR